MQVNRIISATVLSVSLVLGTSSAVSAAAPTSVSTAIVTMASYQTQLAAYKLALSKYNSVLASFKVQVAGFGTAVQTFEASYGDSFETYKAAIRANSQGSNATTNPVLSTVVNKAVTTYTNARVAFEAHLAHYKSAVKSYEAAYATTMKSYRTTVGLSVRVRKGITINYRTAIRNANAVFAHAMAKATTAEQKLAATNVRKRSALQARKVRQARLHELGARPVRPIKQIITYRTDYGVSSSAYEAAIKAIFSANTPVDKAVPSKANTTALTEDTKATVAFNLQLAIYESSVKSYEATYATGVPSSVPVYVNGVQNYDALVTLREELRMAIIIAFETAIRNANSAFTTTIANATTAEQKLAAINTRQRAVDLAKTVRKARFHAVGAKPIRYVKRIRINSRVEEFKGEKPVKAMKPSKLSKPIKTNKP